MATEKPKKTTFNTKLFEVCADDELRPIMQCIHFIEGFAYASNGVISIKQTMELQSILNKEELEGKSLHKDSYKAIMGFEIAECQDHGIYCKNASGQTAFFDYFDTQGEKVPNFAALFSGHKGLTNVTFIGIDPDSFNRLSKAIYNPGNNLRIQFTGVDSHMVIDAVGVDDQMGYLMPKIISASLF